MVPSCPIFGLFLFLKTFLLKGQTLNKSLHPVPAKKKSPGHQPAPEREPIQEEPTQERFEAANGINVLGSGFIGRSGKIPTRLTPANILTLQRLVGNQAVLRLLHLKKEPSANLPPIPPRQTVPAHSQAIQRLWLKTSKQVPKGAYDSYNTDEYIQYIDLDSDPQRLLVVYKDRAFGFLFTRASDKEDWTTDDSVVSGEQITSWLSESEKKTAIDEDVDEKKDIKEEKKEQPGLPLKKEIPKSNYKNPSKAQPTPSFFEKEGSKKEESKKEKEASKKQQLTNECLTHIFLGDTKGDPHKGLHSRRNIQKGTLKVSFFRRSMPDAYGVYAAEVIIQGKKQPKSSVFFPDDWSEEKIKTGIIEAFNNPRTKPKGGAGLAWYGYSPTCKLHIGGLSTVGSTKLKNIEEIDTAYPEFNGLMYLQSELNALIDGDPDPTIGTDGKVVGSSEPVSTPITKEKSGPNSNQPIKKGPTEYPSSSPVFFIPPPLSYPRPTEKTEKPDRRPPQQRKDKPPVPAPAQSLETSFSLNLPPTPSSREQKEKSPTISILPTDEKKKKPLITSTTQPIYETKPRGRRNLPLSTASEEKFTSPLPITTQTTQTYSAPLETEVPLETETESLVSPSPFLPLPQPSSTQSRNRGENRRKGQSPSLLPIPAEEKKPSIFSPKKSPLTTSPGLESPIFLPEKEKKEKKEEKKEEKKGTWKKTENALEVDPQGLNDTEYYTQYLETGGNQERLLVVFKDRSFATVFTRAEKDDDWELKGEIEDKVLADLLNTIDSDVGVEDYEEEFFAEQESKSESFGGHIPKESELKKDAKERGISAAEIPAYIKLRQNRFADQQIKDAGHHGAGADFIADDEKRLWIVEAKGENSSWTSKNNVTFASGPHVPARQVAFGVTKAQTRVVEKLKQPLSQRVSSDRLLLAVTNLSTKDAMMAIITCQDKFTNVVVEKHPVTLQEVIRFIMESGQENLKKLVAMLFGQAASRQTQEIFPPDKLEQIGQLYATDNEGLATSKIEDIITGNLITEWEKLATAKALDQSVYDYLETAYNLARLDNDHNILEGSQKSDNPLSTKKLSKIKSDYDYKKSINGSYYIHLQPVLGKLPGKE